MLYVPFYLLFPPPFVLNKSVIILDFPFSFWFSAALLGVGVFILLHLCFFKFSIVIPSDITSAVLSVCLCISSSSPPPLSSLSHLSSFSSVQFSRSVMSDSLRHHESQHARPPCPSPTPRVHSDSRPSSQWCHPAISSSVVRFPPAPNPSQHQSLFQWVNSSYEVAKVLEFQL